MVVVGKFGAQMRSDLISKWLGDSHAFKDQIVEGINIKPNPAKSQIVGIQYSPIVF